MKNIDEEKKKQALGAMLRQERKKSGKSLSEVSNEFGHYKSWLSDIENGRNNFSAVTMMTLLDYYHADTSEFTIKAINKIKELSNE